MALVEIGSAGRACVLTLRRPEKLNALSTEVERELREALAGPAVAEARCVVLAGEGRAFSAGADVTEFRDRDPAAIAEYYRATGDVYERLAALPRPTISAIHGYCLGGALELALATDFRIADETAQFGFPEAALGLACGSGGIHRLVRIVGPARAKELLLLRPRFAAAEALAFGVVTEVVPEGKALDRALELAEQLADLPALAVATIKQLADAMPEASREAGILLERIGYGMLSQTPEAQQAADSFTRR